MICYRRTAVSGEAYRLAAPGAIPCYTGAVVVKQTVVSI